MANKYQIVEDTETSKFFPQESNSVGKFNYICVKTAMDANTYTRYYLHFDTIEEAQSYIDKRIKKDLEKQIKTQQQLDRYKIHNYPLTTC